MTKRARKPQSTRCVWRDGLDEYDCSWTTACGREFEFSMGGTPSEHHFKFCPYCGASIKAVEFQRDEVEP